VKSRIKPSVRKKAAKPPRKKAAKPSRPKKAVQGTVEPSPTGSCRYTDAFGEWQCDNDVTKADCDQKSGLWRQGGICA
jgi:hypothetical protein